MDLSEEKQIIEKAQADPEAFGLLYERFYHPIFNYILRKTADIEQTKDLTSQTFFKALKGLGKFRWQNISISSWFYRIATNEVNSFYRQKKVVQIGLDKIPEIVSKTGTDDDLKAAEDELSSQKDFLALHQSISKLSQDYRTVISLRFFEKKKISEISEITGKPEGTIKSQIHRALEELETLIS
jgi:RNA polymerase sigma factor (sigma-70 family)